MESGNEAGFGRKKGSGNGTRNEHRDFLVVIGVLLEVLD